MCRAETELLSITDHFYTGRFLCPPGHGRPRVVVSCDEAAERPVPGRACIFHGTAQRAACQTAFKRVAIEANDVRRESYRR